jgi:hypothetical protein
VLFDRLVLTQRFVSDFLSTDLTSEDARAVLRALRMLDRQIPASGLHLHRLEGDPEGAWAVTVSPTVRLTFDELPDGRRQMNTCTRIG